MVFLRRQGQAWTIDEERRLYDGFIAGKNTDELSEAHERSKGGISSRLRRMGLLDDQSQPVMPVPSFESCTKSTISREDRQDRKERHETGVSNGATVIAEDPAETPLLEKAVVEALKNRMGEPSESFDIGSLRQRGIISVRLANGLHRLAIADIRDAGSLTARECLRTPNFGRKTLKELIAVLRFLEGTKDTVPSSAVPADIPATTQRSDLPIVEWSWTEETALQISEYLVALIELDGSERFSRNYNILQLRLGLNDEYPDGLTLQKIGEIYGISRERIRQIVRRYKNAFSRRLKSASYCDQFRRDAHRFFLLYDAISPIKAAAEFCIEYFSPIQAHLILELLCIALARSVGEHDADEAIEHVLKEQKQRQAKQWKQSRLSERWRHILNAATDLPTLKQFRLLPEMDGLQRMPSEDSVGQTGSFQSEKCRREVFFESLHEYEVLRAAEELEDILWYQEQPIRIPYRLNGRERVYYPDLAVLTNRGHGILIEVKPVKDMMRRMTLIKGLAAREWASSRGMAYVIVDHKGRTLVDVAKKSVTVAAIESIVRTIEREEIVTYEIYKNISRRWDLSFGDLLSVVANHDLSFELAPFRLSKLEPIYSFRPFLTL